MTFNLSWWGFIFPNSGLTLATIQIGNSFGRPEIDWVASGMTAVLFTGWFILGICQLKAIWKVLWSLIQNW